MTSLQNRAKEKTAFKFWLKNGTTFLEGKLFKAGTVITGTLFLAR
jgi:hypothetical protein